MTQRSPNQAKAVGRRARRATAAALCALGVLVPAAAAQAAPSSGILPGSRVTLLAGDAVTATATRGSTVYLGGQITGIGLRAKALAATSAATGALDAAVPELEGRGAVPVVAGRVVADGRGGVYVLDANVASVGGVPLPRSSWLRFGGDGQPDRALTQRFTTATGGPAGVTDVAVAADGTAYFAGDFAAVDGVARAGLAAITSGGTLTAWAPQASGGAVSRLYATADGVVLVGEFTTVGTDAGEARSGLALVDAGLGAVRPWSPSTPAEDGEEGRVLTASDAESGIAVDGTTAYLASGSRVYAAGLEGVGAARDLDLQPDEAITAIALGASGRFYVGGNFSMIGAQAAQPARPGVAEIVGATGQATGWAPEAPAGSGARALAVSGDAVYLGGGYSGGFSCDLTRAYRRSDATRTDWDPRLASTGGCAAAGSLAVSGDRVWAVGGDFDVANVAQRNGYAAIDVAGGTQGEILPWAPRSDGYDVRDLAVSSDGQTVYTASDAGTLNLRARNRVAAVAATGAADKAGDVRDWDPAPDRRVDQVVPSADGQHVYLGGSFANVGGQPRANLAEVDGGGTGAATAWRPDPDGPVVALEATADGTLFVGGEFTRIGATPQDRRFLAAFAQGSANPSAWDPALSPDAGSDQAVQDLAVDDGVVYAAGAFDGQIGGQPRRGVAALNQTNGAATNWDAQLAAGGVQTVSTTPGSAVYLIGWQLTSFRSVRGASRPSGMASLTRDGAVTAWNPGVESDGGSSYRLPDVPSTEIVEVAGRLIVPAGPTSGFAFDGVPQSGFLSFETATAPAASDPARPPTVTGRPLVDQQLTCAAGVYAGSRPLTRTYQWLRDGVPIEGETGITYTARTADKDRALSCRERVENAAGTLETVSAAVPIVIGPPSNDGLPAVTGTAQVGATVTCDEGLWSNGPDSFAYAWLRDGAPIGGATARTYVLTDADAGRRVACEVTATNGAGSSEPAGSTAVTVTRQAPPDDNRPPDTNPPPHHENPIPQPPGPGPGPGPGTPKAPPAAPGPKLALSRAVVAKGRAFTVTLKPSAAGRISVGASIKAGRKTIAVGKGSATAKKAGSVTVRVTATKRGKSALKAGRSTKVTFKATLTTRDGKSVTTTKTYKVKIKR